MHNIKNSINIKLFQNFLIIMFFHQMNYHQVLKDKKTLVLI